MGQRMNHDDRKSKRCPLQEAKHVGKALIEKDKYLCCNQVNQYLFAVFRNIAYAR